MDTGEASVFRTLANATCTKLHVKRARRELKDLRKQQSENISSELPARTWAEAKNVFDRTVLGNET
jgi:hypothetical protein